MWHNLLVRLRSVGARMRQDSIAHGNDTYPPAIAARGWIAHFEDLLDWVPLLAIVVSCAYFAYRLYEVWQG